MYHTRRFCACHAESKDSWYNIAMKITISKVSLAERVVALVERAQQKVVFAANLARVYAEVMPSKLDLKRIVLEEIQYA